MSDLLTTRRGAAAVVAGIAVLFFTLRLALLFGRDPFFDELFTAWLARQSVAHIIHALHFDSGPPLYYLIVHALGLRSVTALRWFSLICATGAAAAIVAYRPLGTARFTAAALLAVYPPAVLLAVDARAYALCALFGVLGVLLLDRNRVFTAAIFFVFAAYTHYYGALFFPLLLIGRPVARRLAAFGGAVLLFVPALLLAFHQPVEATRWLTATIQKIDPLTHISFAARYPASLFASAPDALIAVALIALPIAVARSERFGPSVLVPLLIALASMFTPRHVYFPMRFESVIAGGLVLWLASSLHVWQRPARFALVSILMIAGALASYMGIADHLRRPLDAYREAALFAARQNPALPIVASGYCYLETISIVHNRPVIAWPPDQAMHPGWRSRHTAAELDAAGRTMPKGMFLFVAERRTIEFHRLADTRPMQPLYYNDAAIVSVTRSPQQP